MKCIKKYFSVTWRIQEWMMGVYEKRKDTLSKAYKWSWTIYIITFLGIGVLALLTSLPPILFFILIIVLLINLLLGFLSKVIVMFTTISGFLKYGLLTNFTIVLLLIYGIEQFIISNNIFAEDHLLFMYIIFCVLLCLVWAIFSNLTNSKISILMNAIFAVILGVVMQVVEYVLLFISVSSNYLAHASEMEMELLFGTDLDMIKLALQTVLLPLFLMLAFATIMSALKEYWIVKYNDGNDIKSAG